MAIPLNAELWKYQYYENDILVIVREEEPEQIIKTKTNSNTKGITNNSEPTKETIISKSIEEHLEGKPESVKQLFEKINDQILAMSSEIDCYTTNANVLYKTSVMFLELKIQLKGLKLLLRTENNHFDDPKLLTKEVPKTHGWGNLTRTAFVDPNEIGISYFVEDVMSLIKQSYKTTM